MDLKSGFNLFVRQALLYPLASPFLPAPADVKKDVSYANGSKIGTLVVGVPEPIWQTDRAVSFNYTNALNYAVYLGSDGITVQATPQNIWRLPKVSEILKQMSVQALEGGSSVGGFSFPSLYWTSILSGTTSAYTATYQYTNVFSNINVKTFSTRVRCIR